MMHDDSAYGHRPRKRVKKPVKDLEWHIVEVRRLETILRDKINQVHRLRNENTELTLLLGQAQAGMELADLIKRMTS